MNRARPPARAALALLAALAAAPATRAAAAADTLSAEARGVLAHRCYECHSKKKVKGGLRLDERPRALKGGENGPALVPGDAGASELLRRVRLPGEDDDAMPPKGERLGADEVGLLERWIAAGAPWPEGEGRAGYVRAPLAPRRPALPEGRGDLANPIDRFVDAYFSARGADWPEAVGDLLFIRRAHLDTVGLLPSFEEVAHFRADRRPDKRSRLVRSLLARRDDYAQHWLTFWNDLLRNDYSGTGYITGGRKPITGWLYGALAENRPYDQMVRELLTPAGGAGGFIRGITWRGTINASQTTEMQAAQNTAQVFLGLNLKCASCHDSFINDWTLKEAYAYASVFSAAPLEIARCDKPTGETSTAGFLFPELGQISPDQALEERRRELARLMTEPRNGRLARTAVNRLWAQFFGRGLVEPVDAMDAEPWSRDLLDWLAADFAEGGYDLLRTIETIATSRAYQLASVGLEDANALVDPAFVFRGPVVRRLTAEQFADAVSRVAAPVYDKAQFDPPPAPAAGAERGAAPAASATASWIWYPEGKPEQSAPAATRYFWREVELPAGRDIASASVVMAADNAFKLYLNGRAAAAGDEWTRAVGADLTARVKAAGRTVVLAVEATNSSNAPNPAGLIGSFRVDFEDGDPLVVGTGVGWLAATEAGGDWRRSPRRPGRGWKPAAVLGPFGMAPWGGKVSGFDAAAPGSRPGSAAFVRASLVLLDPFLKALGRPTRENVSTARASHATLLQALELTNGKFFNRAVAEGAKSLLGDFGGHPGELAAEVYRRALGRPPTSRESAALKRLLGSRPGAEDVQDLLWAVFLLPEFQLIY